MRFAENGWKARYWLLWQLGLGICFGLGSLPVVAQEAGTRSYSNRLVRIENPKPLLADHPKFFEPIIEQAHFEAPAIVDEPQADLHVRAWRFSYNARGIIEMPNHLQAAHTAVIMVHPWGIDDGQGWDTPEPAGVADFCTKEKNHLAAEHTRTIVKPFINSLRAASGLVLYSLPGSCDPIRRKMYRSFQHTPTAIERAEGAKELDKVLREFTYKGQPLPDTLQLSKNTPVIEYFKQFPGLDAGDRYNNAGFWKLPIPVTTDVDVAPSDVVIFDAEGYEPLKAFLKANDIRHVLLTGYATDMCFCRTTAGYENLSKDFNVFLVADASLATFPSNTSPRFAVNAAISYAALNQLVTQVSWVKLDKAAR
ncbi:MAG: isochorismatase family protein [Pirellulaceae bacterium]|nr:isochorismatase family protein [Pirellulaceae bacterium]